MRALFGLIGCVAGLWLLTRPYTWRTMSLFSVRMYEISARYQINKRLDDVSRLGRPVRSPARQSAEKSSLPSGRNAVDDVNDFLRLRRNGG